MTLVKVNPRHHRRAVRNTKPFGSFLDDFFNNSFDFLGHDGATQSPRVNIKENKDGFHLELAAPGLKKEDFKINIDKNLLKISVIKEEDKEVKEESKYTRREFSYDSFSRSFTLPETINKKAIGAAYESGVLILSLPKKEEAKDEAREITIS